MNERRESATVTTATAVVLDQLESQFSETYRIIESQVARLNDELARAHDERLHELAEKERLASRLQALLNALPAGVVVVDATGHIRDCNPVAVDLLGEPLLGESWREIIERAFDRNASAEPDLRLQDGRIVSLFTCPLRVEPGQIVLLQDVTENRRMREHLEQHRRLAYMGRMAATLAHQIRTPLSSALLYASQLKSPTLDDNRRARFSDKVVDNLRNLERLVNDVLLFARGEIGEREPVAVSDVVAEAVRTFEGQEGLVLRVIDDAPGVSVSGNRAMLASALENVVDNAVRSMEGKGAAEIIVRKAAGDAVEIEVRDEGPGIPVHLKERIFEPFVTGRSNGTGLGLAVVRAVARGHDGEAWAEPRVEGGSSVCMRIPLAREKRVAVPELRLALG